MQATEVIKEMPRGIAGVLLLVAFAFAVFLLAVDNEQSAGLQERVTLQINSEGRRPPSMWGVFPPSHVVDPSNWSELGIRVPEYLPMHLEHANIEVRTGLQGSYMVSIGDEIFLTHRPVDDKSDWTLLVPKEYEGPIHLVSTAIDTQVALGLEIPGDFARIAWSDGRWHYVLFSPVGHSLETLFAVGSSLR